MDGALESSKDEHPPAALLGHADFVSRLAAALVASSGVHEADDLVQDTYLRALRRRPSDVARLRPWLRRVVSGLAISRGREEHRRRRREQAVARSEDAGAGPPLPEETREMQEAVAQAVRALPEHYRDTIVLRYFRDLDHRAIAAEQGIALETVATRLRRGRALLRAKLERDPRVEGSLEHALAPFLPGHPPVAAHRDPLWPALAGVLGAAGLGLLLVAIGLERAPETSAAPASQELESRLRATLASIANQVVCASPVSSSDIDLDLSLSVLQEVALTDRAGEASATERTFRRVRQRTVLGGTFSRQGVPTPIDRAHDVRGVLEGRTRPRIVAPPEETILSLDGLVPPGELVVGDALRLEPGRLAGLLAPPGLFPPVVVDSTQELLDGTYRQGPEHWLTPAAEGEVAARVLAIEDDGAGRVATLALELRLTDDVDHQGGASPRVVVEAPNVELSRMRAQTELTAEGTLAWDLTAERLRSLSLRGELAVRFDVDGVVRMRGGEVARLLRRSHLAGPLELAISVDAKAEIEGEGGDPPGGPR